MSSAPMIQTKEDWRAFVEHTAASPPELPTYDAYKRLPDRERRLIDRQRQAYNSELATVMTPTMNTIMKRIRSTLRVNEHAPPTARRGLVIDGDPTIGKTTLVTAFGKEFELEQRDLYPERFEQRVNADGLLADYCPVVYITTPATATPKMLACTIAEYLGVLYRQRDNTDDITRKVLRAMAACGTQLLIVDDIHFLDLSQKEGRIANDFLKQLANLCAATFVYAGADIGKSSLFNEGSGSVRDTQTSGRFTTYRLERFNIKTPEAATEWATVINAMESRLLLFNHPTGSIARTEWRYLFERTRGSISTLSYLLRMAADEAIESGAEEINGLLLDSIRTDESTQRPYELAQRKKKVRVRATPTARAAAG
jgi:hypothetical protein